MEGDLTADTCVIGLGGSGLAAVAALATRGHRVVGLEARTVAAGAAGRNGGFLLAGLARFYHETVATLGRDRARAWYSATLAELDRLAAESPATIRRTGSLRIATSAEELDDCRAHRDALLADGFAAEAYEGPEGAGLLIPTDGVMQPLARCRALARGALQAGATLAEHSEVVALRSGEVRTERGRVRCGAIIVAVDGGLERLVPALRGRVRTARLQMLATAPDPPLRFSRPVYARWGFEYFQQLPDARIALGGFRDVGGGEEWTAVAGPSAPVQRALDAYLRDVVGASAPVTHRWAALVGFTPDGLPIAEEVDHRTWAVGGYSGTGNVVGAMLARAVASRADGGPPGVLELLAGQGGTA